MTTYITTDPNSELKLQPGDYFMDLNMSKTMLTQADFEKNKEKLEAAIYDKFSTEGHLITIYGFVPEYNALDYFQNFGLSGSLDPGSASSNITSPYMQKLRIQFHIETPHVLFLVAWIIVAIGVAFGIAYGLQEAFIGIGKMGVATANIPVRMFEKALANPIPTIGIIIAVVGLYFMFRKG